MPTLNASIGARVKSLMFDDPEKLFIKVKHPDPEGMSAADVRSARTHIDTRLADMDRAGWIVAFIVWTIIYMPIFIFLFWAAGWLWFLKTPLRIVALIVWIIPPVWAMLTYRRLETTKAMLRSRIRGRQGFITWRTVRSNLSTDSLIKTHGNQPSRLELLRPTYCANLERTGEKPSARAAAWWAGTCMGVPVLFDTETDLYVLGIARSGKGMGIVINRICEHMGPLVVTSVKDDDMKYTIAVRMMRGPVWVMDPEDVSGRGTNLNWCFYADCRDAETARRKAITLTGTSGMGGTSNEVWGQSGGAILQCLLYAAALTDASIDTLFTWTQSQDAAKAAWQILRTHPDAKEPGWAEILHDVLIATDKRIADSKWLAVTTALAGLSPSEVRRHFSTLPSDPNQFTPAKLLDENGTVYLLAALRTAEQTRAGWGPLLALFLDDVKTEVFARAQRQGSGRIDPPCNMELDEIAQIYPWPALTQAVTAGTSQGLNCTIYAQSRSTMRKAYTEDTEEALWENCGKGILCGGADKRVLADVSDLLGDYEVDSRSDNSGGMFSSQGNSTTISKQRIARITPGEIRELPISVGLFIWRNLPPMLIDLIAWTDKEWSPLVQATFAWHSSHPGVMFDRAALRTILTSTSLASGDTRVKTRETR